MDLLWGENGLKLNIIRGKVIHTYNFDEKTGKVSIWPQGIPKDLDNVNKTIFNGLPDFKRDEIGQYWILKQAANKYKVPIMFASTWTPPLYMKIDSTRIDARIDLKSKGPGTVRIQI
ncbi:hypothetical protein [Sphingobacterium sp.]|uniref:hypothetical protein n=1 Tax=Sphingobacterium sp. TaxID=341027 RepID=UPI0031DC5035